MCTSLNIVKHSDSSLKVSLSWDCYILLFRETSPLRTHSDRQKVGFAGKFHKNDQHGPPWDTSMDSYDNVYCTRQRSPLLMNDSRKYINKYSLHLSVGKGI